MKLYPVLAIVCMVAPLTLLLGGCGGKAPQNLGVRDGKLAVCPGSPNCVNSQTADADHHIDPLLVAGDPSEAIQRIAGVVSTMPRSIIAEQTPDYLHVEFASRFFGFVDDVEFLAQPGTGLVQVRSAARSGYYDFGVNRSRLEQIRQKLAAPPQDKTKGTY